MKIKNILELILNTTNSVIKSEQNKQKLNNHNNFEPYAIFTRIDRENKGYLTKDDFIKLLNDNNITIDNKRLTIDLFIDYYDRDFDNKLNFFEFLNFILNKTENIIRCKATQRKTYKIKPNEYLKEDLENLLCSCILNDFYLIEYANIKKLKIFEELNNYKEILDLFIEIDNDLDGFLSSNDFKIFLFNNNVNYINENELEFFLSLFDEDLDGVLNWNEFLFMILPAKLNFDYNIKELKYLEKLYNDFYFEKKREMISKNYEYNLKNNFKEINNINDNNYNNLNLNYNNEINNKNNRIFYQIESHNENNFNEINNNNNIENNSINNLKSNKSLLEFSNILNNILEFELQIEEIRINIINDKNINLLTFFNLFDKYHNGYISFMDFNDTLQNFNIYSNNSIVLFSKYDIENKGRLTKENFIKMFLPINKEIDLNFLNNKINSFNNINDLNEYSKNNIILLFNILIKYMNYLSDLSNWYEIHKNDINYVFNLLDKDKKGYLIEKEFAEIFQDKISIEDLLLIMEKIDSDKDGKITYEDILSIFNK